MGRKPLKSCVFLASFLVLAAVPGERHRRPYLQH